MTTKIEPKIPADWEELRERVVSSECPRCGAQPDYESVEVDSGMNYQRADCGACEFTWWEHYEISDISYADPADDHNEVWRRIHDDQRTVSLLATARALLTAVDADETSGRKLAGLTPEVSKARVAFRKAVEAMEERYAV